jgi:hypothetical protein
MQHAWEEIMPTMSWLVNLKERSHLEELGGKIILKGILKDEEGRARTGPIMLIVVTNGYFII